MMKLKNIVRVFSILTLAFNSFCSYSQLKLISTGTTAYLYDLSVINKNVVISGCYDYLVKSYDECDNIIPIAMPSPTGYVTRFCRPDLNNMFLLSYNPSQTLLYKSSNGGSNWIQKSNTSGSLNHEFAFFDSTEALMSNGLYLSRSNDGGSSWVNVPTPSSFGIQKIKIYKDSLVIIGGVSVPGGLGVFHFSHDRGQTWSLAWGLGGLGKGPTDFFFLNKDTIFGVSEDGGFTKTTNGGQSWNGLSEPPIANSYGMSFKNSKEGYVVGNNSQNLGIILKTTDLGNTWLTFNTGITTSLTNITLLDDSIALLTGTNGILFKWNYKNTIFTGIGENYLDNARLKIFPNPIKDKLCFEFNSTFSENLKLSIINTLGQTIYSKNDINLKEEIDVSFLEQGIYFIKLESENGQKVFKIVKE